MSATRPPLKVPVSFIVISGIAAIFLAAGVIGLSSPELVPPLAKPTIAWSMITVGVVLDVFAVAQLLSHLKRQRNRAGRL